LGLLLAAGAGFASLAADAHKNGSSICRRRIAAHPREQMGRWTRSKQEPSAPNDEINRREARDAGRLSYFTSL
jgi:hypothetical protein